MIASPAVRQTSRLCGLQKRTLDEPRLGLYSAARSTARRYSTPVLRPSQGSIAWRGRRAGAGQYRHVLSHHPAHEQLCHDPVRSSHEGVRSSHDSMRGSHDDDGPALAEVLARPPDMWQERLRLPQPPVLPGRPAINGNGMSSAQVMFKTALNQLDQEGAPSLARGSTDFTDFSMDVPAANEDDGGSSTAETAAALVYSKANFEVLRLDGSGRVRPVYVKRRDLLREHRLQPRDLRRIDPTTDLNKNSRPSLTIKEDVLVLCLGGIRAIVTAEKALFFEPSSPAVKKFLATVVPRLKQYKDRNADKSAAQNSTHRDYMSRFYQPREVSNDAMPPFELEVLEGTLIIATCRLDSELLAVTHRVHSLLQKLPADINPANLEELRRVKQALVEVENRADTLRDMLEELMDDEDELRDMNLTNRPRREERRRMRERDRLERELDRAREAKEELVERRSMDGSHDGEMASSSSAAAAIAIAARAAAAAYAASVSGNGVQYNLSGGGLNGSSAPPLGEGMTDSIADQGFNTSLRALEASAARRNGGTAPGSILPVGHSTLASGAKAKPEHMSREARQQRILELRSKFDRERLAALRAKFDRDMRDDGRAEGKNGSLRGDQRERILKAVRESANQRGEPVDWESALEGSDEDIQEAQDALEEMVEAEEEARELEEVEDLLEYYVQRAAATQSEAERLLSGARDLEESIGVSLSARRYEVNRIELMLAIGSFAAAIGAVVAGIFGMNMKSTLESSVGGFWGVSALIVFCCSIIFISLMKYTQNKRIL